MTTQATDAVRTQAVGNSPVYFSCHELQAYYGESYIVQASASMCTKAKFWPC